MAKLSIEDLDVKGKTVLMRADFNVPLDLTNPPELVVTDDTRINAAIPTIKLVHSRGGKVVIMSHLGRPGGTANMEYSLRPVAARLQELLGLPVTFIQSTVGEETRSLIEDASDDAIVLLENTRFFKEETDNDSTFAEALASNGDVFVNDAFGTAHRAHASTEGITHFVESAAMGLLVAREIKYLSTLTEAPEHPFIAILGGAKVSDKIGVIENLLDKVDHILIGGAMSYTFLKALGTPVGKSRVEEDKLDVARDLFERAHGKIVLPSDHVSADEFAADAKSWIDTGSIREDGMGLDIGPETRRTYAKLIASSRTAVWNGPMGVFEMPAFAEGTIAIAQALADATKEGTLSVVGGGDSVAAIAQAQLDDDVSHVSTGGGAMLEYLEGKRLPGIEALTNVD